MILVFLSLIVIITLFFLIFICSTLKIKIEDFKLENLKNDNRYKIYIQLYFLGKIKILSIKFDNKRINKISTSSRFKNIDYKKLKEKMPPKIDMVKCIKMLRLQVEKLKLNAQIGFNEPEITIFAVTVLSTILSILLTKTVKNRKYIKYKINPIFNTNNINISYESIISLKIVHIIYMLNYFVKKGRDKNGRTSNRRTYGYSHGFN